MCFKSLLGHFWVTSEEVTNTLRRKLEEFSIAKPLIHLFPIVSLFANLRKDNNF